MTETTTTLATALARFQQSLPRIGKDNIGVIPGRDGKQGYKYEYADLADISAVALPLLGKVGLSWSTKPTLNEHGTFVLEYRLRHGSGEEDVGEYPLPDPARTPAQQVGSGITYARRYALCCVTGIAPGGDDDDAAAAQNVSPQSYERPPQRGGNAAQQPNHGNGNGQPPVKPPAEKAREGAVMLLDATDQKRLDALVAYVPNSGAADQDVSKHLTADDRAALDLDANDKLTLGDLADTVAGYWGKHHQGPRMDPQVEQAVAS